MAKSDVGYRKSSMLIPCLKPPFRLLSSRKRPVIALAARLAVLVQQPVSCQDFLTGCKVPPHSSPPTLLTVGNLLPYHLLSYGALLGTELYQVRALHISHGAELNPWAELCQHQDLLPSPSDEGIHHSSEATLPGLLCHPGWTDGSDGSDLPAIQHPVTAEEPVECWIPRSYGVDGLSELVRVWPEDDDHRIGEKGVAGENIDADSNQSKVDRANRNFSRNHAMVIHLNAIAMIATVVYGFSLSSTLLAGL
ncbi:hypothetical protein PENANT_c004G06056 [Penicillium antarcticum]|uniref:Uncharacterized protein n=1 Tax=Penicillium antarcticum TaxID=416450 RepID=A0A1V6QGI3_9EURO|nr:hypothetical protein PENANT_c004G06056 [Penicillium antarcticum]